LHAVHCREAIDTILHRECARCERSGNEFSLVLFDLGPDQEPSRFNGCALTPEQRLTLSSRPASRMARILLSRTRATDDVGWFDEHRLCAVLSDTGPEGAQDFIRGIAQIAEKHGFRPGITIYTYPSSWLDAPREPKAEDRPRVGVQRKSVPAVKPIESLLVMPMPRWKRALDVAASATALVVASPILAGAALAIKLSSAGPILFKQKRAGLGGRPFVIYKFRTMVIDAEKQKAALKAQSEQDGPAFKIKHDPRITRVGRFLRESSIDELPQLLNVLKGDMSLVGPRPLPVDESNACDTWHRRRLDVTPGLTCIWQVKGRSTVSFADWARMDRSYIRGRSLLHDLKLILMTVPAVLMRRGAR
jgi:lipopolysaccharide/colanic/teichoic acid biosynthesis glycosyltransferase